MPDEIVGGGKCRCGCGTAMTSRRASWVRGHWSRRPLRERFEEKLERTDTCWLWCAAHTGYGYGKIKHNGRLVDAHRIAYELYVGPIPSGLTIDHLCRNRACVNPAHLEPVTLSVNALRAYDQSACQRGHATNSINTYWYRGLRHCRPCRAYNARKYRRRQHGS